MSDIPIPPEVIEEAQRLVTQALSTVPLDCADMREEVVNLLATVLAMRPANAQHLSRRQLAERCISAANASYQRAPAVGPTPDQDPVRMAVEDMRSHIFARMFP